jgi:uncharacterized protein YodC (DUF2158 family)
MTTAPNLIVLAGFLPEFQIGATVRLKSGSPTMTVTAVEDRHVEVHWFEGDVGMQKIFPVAALKAISKSRREQDETVCGRSSQDKAG